jgi:hypothetical protein
MKTDFDRRATTILHNNAITGVLPFGAKKALMIKAFDAIVAQGYARRDAATDRYHITPAGEARLLDRSDVSREEEAAIAREAMQDHEDTAHDRR